jgi:hypothetical protein
VARCDTETEKRGTWVMDGCLYRGRVHARLDSPQPVSCRRLRHAKAQTGTWKLFTCNKQRCATKPHSSFCASIHWSSAQPQLTRCFPCATRHWGWKWLHWSRLRYIYSVQTEPIAGSNTTEYWTGWTFATTCNKAIRYDSQDFIS